MKKTYLKFSDELYEIYRDEYKKAFLSELNNVYVALTRAQKELYGFIPKKVGNSFNLAQLLIPEEICQFGQPQKYKGSSPKGVLSTQLPAAQYHDWIDYLKDEFLQFDAMRNKEQKLKGSIIHFILSFVKNLAVENKEEILKYALDEARMQYPQVQDFDEPMDIVRSVLSEEELKGLFYLDEGEVYTEEDFVTSKGHTRRLDRVIVGEKNVVIVDYKLSRDREGKYEEQVQEYMAIVGEVYPGREVKGYLIYLDDGELEEVNE